MMATTRYFIFSKAAPSKDDEERIIKTCEVIDAFLCYSLVRREDKGRDYLRGIIVLRGPRTTIDGRALYSHFPNVMLRYVGKMEFDFDSLPDNVKIFGDHPFKKLRRTLFPHPSSLSYYLKGG